MSRDLMKFDGTYYISTSVLVPVKWTAPEAITDRKYSTASDVWSYQKVKQSAELHKVYCFATLREIDGSDRLMDKLSNTIAAYRTAGSKLADSVLAPPLQFSWLVYEVYEVVHKERP